MPRPHHNSPGTEQRSIDCAAGMMDGMASMNFSLMTVVQDWVRWMITPGPFFLRAASRQNLFGATRPSPNAASLNSLLNCEEKRAGLAFMNYVERCGD